MHYRFSTVLYDLDGTLFDTAPDIFAACNCTLVHFGFPQVPISVLQGCVTSGMRAMLKAAIPPEQQDEALIAGPMRDYFAAYYTEHLNCLTTPFAGIPKLVEALAKQGVKQAVITNKYERMAKKLLDNFSFCQSFSLLLGCDSLTHSKPHPEPLLKAMDRLQAAPQSTLYIGDHLNDIKAARAAGCMSCAALWGYGEAECGAASSWGADYLCRSPEELAQLLGIAIPETV
ncbi:MAG: HAD-IA family hydrolase [Succinivibrio sp.]|nr:HAD-IA family hydrolase [Succinivibrio sp.]